MAMSEHASNHRVIYRVGADQRRLTLAMTLGPGSTRTDVREACAQASGCLASDIHVLVIAPPLTDLGELATRLDVPPQADGHSRRSLKLATDMPESDWPDSPDRMRALIKLMMDRRFRAARRGDAALVAQMDALLIRARQRRNELAHPPVAAPDGVSPQVGAH